MSDPRPTYRTEDVFGRIHVAHHPFDDVASTRTAIVPFAYAPPRRPIIEASRNLLAQLILLGVRDLASDRHALLAERSYERQDFLIDSAYTEIQAKPLTLAQRIADFLCRIVTWLKVR